MQCGMHMCGVLSEYRATYAVVIWNAECIEGQGCCGCLCTVLTAWCISARIRLLALATARCMWVRLVRVNGSGQVACLRLPLALYRVAVSPALPRPECTSLMMSTLHRVAVSPALNSNPN